MERTKSSLDVAAPSQDDGIDDLLRAIAHAPPRAAPVDLPVGAKLGGPDGRYVVERRLGRGGMGVVYVARDTLLGRDVAIKVLDLFDSDPEAHRVNLLREARFAARVEHERLARVYDVGEFEGAPFLAMELVRGTTLREWMTADRRDPPMIVSLLRQIAAGLSALHRAGVVHRDLKPENVMLTEGSQVKLLDFGLARLAREIEEAGDPGALQRSGGRTGLSGTPGYMAPELTSGAAIDPRVDVFAFGVLLYELVAGAQPFVGRTRFELCEAMKTPPSFSRAVWRAHPEALQAIAARALAADPRARFADGTEIASAFERLAPRPRALKVGAAALAAVLLATGIGAAAPWKSLAPPVPPQAGMVAIEGGTYPIGRSAEGLEKECAALGKTCDREMLQRETPGEAVKLGRFALDIDEMTNARGVPWLNAMNARLTVVEDTDDHYPRYAYLQVTSKEQQLVLDLHPDASGVEFTRERTFRVKPGREKLPLIQITWFGAREICRLQGKRLPTENEWEAAARGRADRRFPWGDAEIQCGGVVVANDGQVPMSPCADKVEIQAVGAALQDVTPEGIRGLAGNVTEWVDAAFVVGNRLGASESREAARILRGGSFAGSDLARSTARTRRPADSEGQNVGFRCAADG